MPKKYRNHLDKRKQHSSTGKMLNKLVRSKANKLEQLQLQSNHSSSLNYKDFARDLLKNMWPYMSILLFDQVNGLPPIPPGPHKNPKTALFNANGTDYGLFFSNYVPGYDSVLNGIWQGQCGNITNNTNSVTNLETIKEWDSPWDTEFKRGVGQEMWQFFEECVEELVSSAINSMEDSSESMIYILAGILSTVSLIAVIAYFCYTRRSRLFNRPVAINEIVVEAERVATNNPNQTNGEKEPLLVSNAKPPQKLTHEERLEAAGVETNPHKNPEIKDFICPSEKAVMDEPYTITPCGHNMEYDALIRALEINGGNCPCCRTPVLKDNKDAYIIVKNQYLKTKIIEYVEAAEKKAKETKKLPETQQNNDRKETHNKEEEKNSKTEVELETIKDDSNEKITKQFN